MMRPGWTVETKLGYIPKIVFDNIFLIGFIIFVKQVCLVSFIYLFLILKYFFIINNLKQSKIFKIV